MREKMSKQPSPAPTASAVGPFPTISRIRRTPTRKCLAELKKSMNTQKSMLLVLSLVLHAMTCLLQLCITAAIIVTPNCSIFGCSNFLQRDTKSTVLKRDTRKSLRN